MRKVRTTAGKGRYQWDYQELRYLVHVLQEPKNFADILNIFLDLHTQKEMSEIVRRLLIASMLIRGDSYQDIRSATGASPNTVVRISRKLRREKSVLEKMLKQAGSFEDFAGGQQSDAVRRRIDRLLNKVGFGSASPK